MHKSNFLFNNFILYGSHLDGKDLAIDPRPTQMHDDSTGTMARDMAASAKTGIR